MCIFKRNVFFRFTNWMFWDVSSASGSLPAVFFFYFYYNYDYYYYYRQDYSTWNDKQALPYSTKRTTWPKAIFG